MPIRQSTGAAGAPAQEIPPIDVFDADGHRRAPRAGGPRRAGSPHRYPDRLPGCPVDPAVDRVLHYDGRLLLRHRLDTQAAATERTVRPTEHQRRRAAEPRRVRRHPRLQRARARRHHQVAHRVVPRRGRSVVPPGQRGLRQLFGHSDRRDRRRHVHQRQRHGPVRDRPWPLPGCGTHHRRRLGGRVRQARRDRLPHPGGRARRPSVDSLAAVHPVRRPDDHRRARGRHAHQDRIPGGRRPTQMGRSAPQPST